MKAVTIEAATMYFRKRSGVYRVHLVCMERVAEDAQQVFGRDYDAHTPDAAITMAVKGAVAICTGALESAA